MKLRRLEVEHFRGLSKFCWNPTEGLNILIGPGDSAKTTVLDAIDLALGPRWNPGFTDADFTNSDTTQDIVITATVGDLPKEILGDGRFQDHFRGWSNGELHDEPVDDGESEDEPVLSIRLVVGSSLEPVWSVWTERQSEQGPAILGKDRERLGVVRVGNYVDRHMGWGRGSALAQYGDSIDDLTPVFAEVRRQSRAAFSESDLPELKSTSKTLGEEAKKIGVRISTSLQPGLDFSAVRDGATSISLYDGDVPTKQMGLGSKRLLTIAMQLGHQNGQQLLLVDEIEAALEPYRIRHLMRTLIATGAQAVATTHSPVVLQESASQGIFQLSRTEEGVGAFPAETQLKNLLKKHPNALLSRRVVCCEGQTEFHAMRALSEIWQGLNYGDLATLGVEFVNCDGAGNVGSTSRAFLAHNLPTAIFADADESINLPQTTVQNPLLKLVQQDDNQSFEQALFRSLSDDLVDTLLAKMVEFLGSEGHLRAQLSEYFSNLSGVVRSSQLFTPISGNRQDSLARAASEKKWFKKSDQAYYLLISLDPYWTPICKTSFGKKTEVLRKWCYAE